VGAAFLLLTNIARTFVKSKAQMTLDDLKIKYRTLIGIEIIDIKKIREAIYIVIKKNYQGGLFSNIGLEQNIRTNINIYFPDRKLIFLWLYPGPKDINYILSKEYVFHISDVLMISKIINSHVTTIYVHGKKRIHFSKRKNVIIGDLINIGGLEFDGFNLNKEIPDIININTNRFFCLTPIPCIAKIEDGRVFFEYFFEKYTVGLLNKLTIKIQNNENRTINK
jgi:hypothetical protein